MSSLHYCKIESNYLVKTNSLVRPLTAVDDDVAGYAGCRHDIQRCVLLQNGADRLEGCQHHHGWLVFPSSLRRRRRLRRRVKARQC